MVLPTVAAFLSLTHSLTHSLTLARDDGIFFLDPAILDDLAPQFFGPCLSLPPGSRRAGEPART